MMWWWLWLLLWLLLVKIVRVLCHLAMVVLVVIVVVVVVVVVVACENRSCDRTCLVSWSEGTERVVSIPVVSLFLGLWYLCFFF